MIRAGFRSTTIRTTFGHRAITGPDFQDRRSTIFRSRPDLQAQGIHRRNFDPNTVETESPAQHQTGGCPDDCGYALRVPHYEHRHLGAR